MKTIHENQLDQWGRPIAGTAKAPGLDIQWISPHQRFATGTDEVTVLAAVAERLKFRIKHTRREQMVGAYQLVLQAIADLNSMPPFMKDGE